MTEHQQEVITLADIQRHAAAFGVPVESVVVHAAIEVDDSLIEGQVLETLDDAPALEPEVDRD